MEAEEEKKDAAEDTVIAVELFVGEACDECNGAQRRFDSKKIVERKLRGSNDAETLRQVEII